MSYNLSDASRKTSAEFGYASHVSAIIFKAIKTILRGSSGKIIYNKLCSVAVDIINTAPTALKGKRKLYDGNVALLKGFQLNPARRLDGLLNFVPGIEVVPKKEAIIRIPNVTDRNFNPPKRADSIALKFFGFIIDIENNLAGWQQETADLLIEVKTNTLSKRLPPVELSGKKKIRLDLQGADNCLLLISMSASYYIFNPGGESFLSGNKQHFAAEIVEAVYIKDGELQVFNIPEIIEKTTEIKPSAAKLVQWEDDNE